MCKSSKHKKNFYCEEKDCKILPDKCGEIDLFSEGLSVIGEFIETTVTYSEITIDLKLLWVHARSGFYA